MLYIKDGKTFRALQFIVTREVQCKYGTHKDYNSMDIAILMKTALNVHFDKEGPYFYLGDKTENVVVRVGDYVVMDEEGKVHHYTQELFEKEFVSIGDYYKGEDEHPKNKDNTDLIKFGFVEYDPKQYNVNMKFPFGDHNVKLEDFNFRITCPKCGGSVLCHSEDETYHDYSGFCVSCGNLMKRELGMTLFNFSNMYNPIYKYGEKTLTEAYEVKHKGFELMMKVMNMCSVNVNEEMGRLL